MPSMTRRTTLIAAAALSAPPLAPGAFAQAPAAAAVETLPKLSTARSTDGTGLAVQEWGNPAGLPVVLIHGFSQAHLCWRKQVTDPTLTDALRMITFDLRGHGLSDKPVAREAYQPAKVWADDVKAVIEATGAVRPVLAGWSYAGRVISDYLLVHGPAQVSGVNFVNAVTHAAMNMQAPASPVSAGMVADDLATQIRQTRAFLRACFVRQPDQDAFETMVAFNAMTPAAIRRNMLGRPTPYEAMFQSLRLPVLVSHGREDKAVIPAVGEYTAASIPGAQASFYDGTGHLTFWEEAPRFNRELLAFVRAARG
ncbi:MAG: alpha/beta hydrolase [Rhizobiales bacterium]|nr:alpha/beta hydrolase [Hyphomicrobiales bacterium]